MPEHQDFYATLGVNRDATAKQIREAYRRLARQHHPDVNPGNQAASERFKQINEAYHVLSDPKLRKDYDEFGPNWRHADELRKAGVGAGGGRGGFSWADFGSRGAGGSRIGGLGDFGDLGDLLGQFGFGGRGRRGPSRRTQQVSVEITVLEAYRGTTRVISYGRAEPCSACSGAGTRGSAPCNTCGGAGFVQRPVRLEVNIPAGVEDGGKIRLTPDNATEIILQVSIAPDPRFRRTGVDLHTEVRVPLTVAVLGGEVEVPTLTGKVMLKIPEGTQNGRIFKLGGKGMPQGRSGNYGSLYAAISVVLPTRLTPEERALFNKIREIEEAPRERARAS